MLQAPPLNNCALSLWHELSDVEIEAERKAERALRVLLEQQPSTATVLRGMQQWGPCVKTPGRQVRLIRHGLGMLYKKTLVTLKALDATHSFLKTCESMGWFTSVPVFIESERWTSEAGEVMRVLCHDLSANVKKSDGSALFRLLVLLEALAKKPDGTCCDWAPGRNVPSFLAACEFPFLKALALKPDAFQIPPLTRKEIRCILKIAISTLLNGEGWGPEDLCGKGVVKLETYGNQLFETFYPLYPTLVTSEIWSEVLSQLRHDATGPVTREGYTLILTAARRAHEASVLQQTLDTVNPSALTDTLSPTRRRL